MAPSDEKTVSNKFQISNSGGDMLGDRSNIGAPTPQNVRKLFMGSY